MLESLIIKAQGSDNEAMLELINKFSPLLKKYARRLNYEDAQNDLTLYFIQLIHGMNLEKMLCKENGSIINYISICIKNYHNKKIAEIVNLKKEIVHTSLSEEQLYYVDVKLSGVDQLYIKSSSCGIVILCLGIKCHYNHRCTRRRNC